jgi:hypothetical protein
MELGIGSTQLVRVSASDRDFISPPQYDAADAADDADCFLSFKLALLLDSLTGIVVQPITEEHTVCTSSSGIIYFIPRFEDSWM